MDLKELLKKDFAFGTLVASTSPHFINATKGGGVDYVFIDTEHIPIDREKMSWLCRTYSGMGITPICRVPEPDAFRLYGSFSTLKLSRKLVILSLFHSYW